MIRPLTRAREDAEAGAVMIFVLVLVVVVALMSTAFLRKSGTELHAGAVLQTKLRLNYAADAGVEQGIATLKAELAKVNRTNCLTPFEGPKNFATFPMGSAPDTVSVTCEDLQGYAADNSAAGIFGAAIVATGGAHSFTTQSAVNSSLDVGGTIYLSGSENGGDIKKQVNLTRGDVAQQGCSGTPSISQITVAAPYSQYCTAFTPLQVATAVTLPASVPPAAPAPVTLSGNKCRVFYPGTYTAAPALLSGNNTSNYFASGDYYFDGNFQLSIPNNTEVVAGAKSPGDVDALKGNSPITACSNDADASTLTPTAPITSTGVAIYMGQASSVSIAQGTLAMYSRPVTAGIDVPLNIYAIRSTDTGWDTWTGGSTPVVGVTNPNANMLFNGQINAYSAPVQIFASNPTYAAVRAGIVASTVDLQASASGTNLDVSGYGTGSTVGSRIVRLTAVANGPANDPGTATGTAVVRFYNDTTKAPVVLSWRYS